VTETIGIPTVSDILDELEKPGRDPRKKMDFFRFDENIKTMEDLKEGAVLPGVITNITDFGAFVDIGIHENGLIHKSNMAKAYVSHPSEQVSLGQHVEVKIIAVDIPGKRISLSLLTD
ncbi:MAG TPA: S1 RNA-binding domain-containing protein, partial [Bacteroidetes bacterium]|nr:S1 RNA-binding domain-containing protein [Bacteroidota bacterium]